MIFIVILFIQTAIDSTMSLQGLIRIQSVDSTIKIELKYSSRDNFMSMDMYGDFNQAYLLPEIAEKLKKANDLLKKLHPNYRLLVYDAARPGSIQKIMWEKVKGTAEENYVADPKIGSIHNYGAAVDLTICTVNNEPLDMGTAYDYFGDLAQPRYEDKFLKEKKLTKKQIAHRQLLRKVMTSAGFEIIANEWWHFNGLSLSYLRAHKKIID